MSYVWFVKIYAAYHPENGNTKDRDKCQQLRNAITDLNKAIIRTFVLGREVSFDTGDVLSESQNNTVKQYNSCKSHNYIINVFILDNTSGGHNIIYHFGMYQKKNENNISILPDLWSLPTTQKTVVNAVVSTRLYKD